MFTKCNQRNEGKGNKKALEEINKTHCVMHSKLWGIYTIFLLSIMELTSDSKKLTLSTHSSNILLRLVSVFLNQTLRVERIISRFLKGYKDQHNNNIC